MQIYNNFKECSFRIKNILVFGSFLTKVNSKACATEMKLMFIYELKAL